jgi:antitoxin component HigA of HigAB toxin-antitoxin module
MRFAIEAILTKFIGRVRMHKSLRAILLLVAGLPALPVALAAEDDSRVAVDMPAMMQDHTRANMRDHLLAINEIQRLLAAGKYDAAADVAEKRIGMSSLEAHGASHLAGFMPQGMQDIGTAMHKAASRFAVTAQEAGVTRDLPRALGALSEVTTQCVACHAAYRLK